MDKILILEAIMLTNPTTGMHTKWSYYSDGSIEVTHFPGSPAVLIPIIPIAGSW